MTDSHHWDDLRTAARAAARLAESPEARAIHEEPARRYAVEAERDSAAEPALAPAAGDGESPAATPARSIFRPLSLWPDARGAPPRRTRR